MSILIEERQADSPLIEKIIHGWTLSAGSPIRPAESQWHIVFVRENGAARSILVGPWSSSGVATYGAGAEILWIKLKLGVYLTRMPTRQFADTECILPEAGNSAFWLDGSTRELPRYENAEGLILRLAREDAIFYDPVVRAAVAGEPLDIAPRTLRHHFLHATGLTQTQIRQFQRAQHAAALLAQGISILDTVYEAGYFDQPHLTRALKHWIGHTPAEILRQ